jgi:hypothetical protein
MDDYPNLNILLYCNRPSETENAGTVIDHIDAFAKYSRHNVLLWSSMNGLPGEEVLSKIDCIVIHYTLSLLYDAYIPSESLDRIRDFLGMKVLFIQDEYRRVNFVCEKIKHAKLDAVFTCAPRGVSEEIYAALVGEVKLLPTLTGYVSEKLVGVKTQSIAERSIDVGYRARKCPFWLGRKSHEKYVIGKLFLEYAKKTDLKCDVSANEKDRIYGSKWVEFVSDCRATLGTESGASIIDFTGRVEYNLNRWQAFRPFAKFEDVPEKLLEHDGKIELQVISPRCFEAAALGTVMIMYPGEYSGLLEAGRHYLMLEKDFSNIGEVIRQLGDHQLLEKIVANARKDLVDSGKCSYRQFVENFDSEVEKLGVQKNWKPSGEEVFLPSSPSETSDVIHNRFGSLRDSLLHYKRLIWKHLPHWFKFLIGVTLLKKKVYGHFGK